MSDVTECQKTQVLDCTSSTVHAFIFLYFEKSIKYLYYLIKRVPPTPPSRPPGPNSHSPSPNMRAYNPPSKNKLKRPFVLDELLPNKRLLKAAALTDSVVVEAEVVAAVVEVEVDMTTDRYQMSENKVESEVENALYSCHDH